MKNFLKALFPFLFAPSVPPYFTGVLDDTRPLAVKELDPIHEEVAAGGTPVTWISKTSDTWKTILPHRDQDGSSGCLSFASATSFLNNLRKVFPSMPNPTLSAHDVYQRRSNYPGEGMIPMDSLTLAAAGICTEATLPSDNLSEAQMNVQAAGAQILSERAANAGGLPVKLNLPLDIDQAASIIDQGLSLVLCVHFNYSEWVEVAQLTSSNPDLGHGIASVDRTLYNGVKAIIIQDQWKIDSTMYPGGLRVLSEQFLKARCFFAGYILPKKDEIPAPLPAPAHTFTVDMQYGDNNNEVMLLQTKLHSLGFLSVNPTGYFGGLTKAAVIAFQAANGVPQTGYVGPLTRAKLNK